MTAVVNAANRVIDKIAAALGDAVEWVTDWLIEFLDRIWNLLIDLVNFLISVCGSVLSSLVSLLPDTNGAPIAAAPDPGVAGFVNFINWVLPVDVIVAALVLVAASYAAYFTVGRILKVLQVL